MLLKNSVDIKEISFNIKYRLCVLVTSIYSLNCQEYKRVLLYYSFNAEGNAWVRESSGSDMNRGKGYIVRGAGTGLTSAQEMLHLQESNNGAIPVTIVELEEIILGNPYPSAIDGAAYT
jgi:hypothetical protein